eukprot:4276488-Prymnesium_polylepis.2
MWFGDADMRLAQALTQALGSPCAAKSQMGGGHPRLGEGGHVPTLALVLLLGGEERLMSHRPAHHRRRRGRGRRRRRAQVCELLDRVRQRQRERGHATSLVEGTLAPGATAHSLVHPGVKS